MTDGISGSRVRSEGDGLIVLGLDPGSIKTGFGVLEVAGQGQRLVDCGCLKAGSRLALPARLAAMYDGLMEVLSRFGPDDVAIEQVFSRVNVETALKLSHVRGVLMLGAAQRHLPISEYAPSQIKRAVVGTGRASKEQVQFMIQRLLRLEETPPSDAADALAVALCHAHQQAVRIPG